LRALPLYVANDKILSHLGIKKGDFLLKNRKNRAVLPSYSLMPDLINPAHIKKAPGESVRLKQTENKKSHIG